MKKRINLSAEELAQVAIFEQLRKGSITQVEAAEQLGLSTRHIRRKLELYQAQGAESLIHKARNKRSNNTLSTTHTEKILTLVKRKYSELRPTFTSELLAKNDNISIHSETLRLLLIKNGLWRVKKSRKEKHRLWREPKPCFGEMIQIDGSYHNWFEGRAPYCTLIAFIDDATSIVCHLMFAPHEDYESIMKATRAYLLKHGKPLSFYSDKGRVYRVNNNNPDHERTTQYEKALQKLGIKIIHAHSPQAKGRVERSFRTPQERLPYLLRERNISSIDAANEFLQKEYMFEYATKYARQPAQKRDLHRPLLPHENLDDILCLYEERKLHSDFTINYQTRWFQLARQQPTILRSGELITVQDRFNGDITLYVRKQKLIFIPIAKRPAPVQKESKKKVLQPYFPDENSPTYGKLRIGVR